MAKAEIKLRYGGLKPKKIIAKVVYSPPRTPSSTSPPTSWTPLPSSSAKPERLTLFLDSRWMIYEGWLTIRLESDAGDTEVKIPIKTPTPTVRYRPPAKVKKKPIQLKIPISNLKYGPRLKELARMIVELKPDRLIKTKANDLLRKVRSETKGLSPQAYQAILKSLKDQVNKKIRENEKNKQLTQGQLQQVQRLLAMIQLMMELI